MGENSGRTVASAGDVNGDGFDDLIMVRTSRSYGTLRSSYVVFGQAGGFAADIHLADLDGTNGFRMTARIDFSSAVPSPRRET